MYLTLAFLFGILFPVSAIARGIVLKTDPYRVVIFSRWTAYSNCNIRTYRAAGR